MHLFVCLRIQLPYCSLYSMTLLVLCEHQGTGFVQSHSSRTAKTNVPRTYPVLPHLDYRPWPPLPLPGLRRPLQVRPPAAAPRCSCSLQLCAALGLQVPHCTALHCTAPHLAGPSPASLQLATCRVQFSLLSRPARHSSLLHPPPPPPCPSSPDPIPSNPVQSR